MTNIMINLIADTDNFMSIFFGGFSAIAIVMYIVWAFVISKWLKNRRKLKEKEIEERVKSDLGMKRLEIEAGKDKPVFCTYCGAKCDRSDAVCGQCGGSLKD